MRSLPLRRFPDRVTRLHRGAGLRNNAGEWVPGGVTETELAASVQPAGLEDADEESGARLVDRIVVYLRGEDMVLGAFDDNEADRLRWRGQTYVVTRSMSWSGSHTRAVCVRQGDTGLEGLPC